MTGGWSQGNKFRSFRNSVIDGYKKALGEIDFCNYENCHSVNDAYSNFVQKIIEFIDKVVLIKDLSRNSQELRNSQVALKIYGKLINRSGYLTNLLDVYLMLLQKIK